MANYILPALSKLSEFFADSINDVEFDLEQYDDDDNTIGASDTKDAVVSLIDLKIKELQKMKITVKRSIKEFIKTDF